MQPSGPCCLLDSQDFTLVWADWCAQFLPLLSLSTSVVCLRPKCSWAPRPLAWSFTLNPSFLKSVLWTAWLLQVNVFLVSICKSTSSAKRSRWDISCGTSSGWFVISCRSSTQLIGWHKGKDCSNHLWNRQSINIIPMHDKAHPSGNPVVDLTAGPMCCWIWKRRSKDPKAPAQLTNRACGRPITSAVWKMTSRGKWLKAFSMSAMIPPTGRSFTNASSSAHAKWVHTWEAWQCGLFPNKKAGHKELTCCNTPLALMLLQRR